MGEALGELKYVSVTFAIEGAQEDLGPVVRAEFTEPEKFSGDSGLQRADNAPVEGYLVRNGIFTASLLESPQLLREQALRSKYPPSQIRRIDKSDRPTYVRLDPSTVLIGSVSSLSLVVGFMAHRHQFRRYHLVRLSHCNSDPQFLESAKLTQSKAGSYSRFLP
jgi:hypothetical protein